jgi:hypothetical protein
MGHDTIILETILAQILSQLESLLKSQQVMQAKVGRSNIFLPLLIAPSLIPSFLHREWLQPLFHLLQNYSLSLSMARTLDKSVRHRHQQLLTLMSCEPQRHATKWICTPKVS